MPKPLKKVKGFLTIKVYTIPYDRNGKLKWGIVVGHLEDSQRVIASILTELEIPLELEMQELFLRF